MHEKEPPAAVLKGLVLTSVGVKLEQSFKSQGSVCGGGRSLVHGVSRGRAAARRSEKAV